MSNTIKKISSIGLSMTTAVWLSGAAMVLPVASAATAEELQAQINALLTQIQQLQQQLATQTPATPTYSFTRDLTVGSKGDDVKALQQFLNSKGYKVADTGAGSPGNETTIFGPLTKAALAKYQKAVGISPAVGYFGPKTRAYVASLAAAPTTPTTPTTPVSGLALALASDNPAGAVIPKGAAGVEMLKFTVSGKGTITSLTFKRKGIGATGDFASTGFYLYEGNSRLTSGRSINSTSHEVTFVNLNIAVDGTKTLSLRADISSSATANNNHYFELVGVTGDPTPTGSLVGNTMTIGGQQVGGVVVAKVGSISNPYIGQTNAQVSEFKLTASSTEDISVKQLALTQGGTISNSNLSNFVLKLADGTVLAKASGVGAKDLITFTFDTPYTIEKGQEKTLRVYADISGAAKSSDTIKLYFDSKGDVSATGKTYGYPVDPDITALDTSSEAHAITLSGGDVTITFNGPVTGDLALRGQDVELYNFTIASKNNIEIRNLRFHATTTGLTSGEGFNDFKVWDTASNAVVTSASDVTTSTDVTFTDVINISAGASKTYKVTADVDADNDANDDITVSLLAFQSSDIKNLDNNQFVSTSNIVPNSTISGNAQTVKVPTLDVQLAATPSSQTYVQGAANKDLVGFSFRAIASDIKLSSVKVTASSTSGTLTSGEVQSLALYDGATKVSDVKSLDSTALTATFDNLNLTITKGSTKVLTLKGSISANATNGDVYYFYIAAADSDNITATDKDGNSATLQGTAANSGYTVKHTITTSGDVSVVVAPDDSESEAGIVIAGTESVLGKYRFTATNEDMTVNKMQILVTNSSSATATSTATADEVPTIKLYDGTTQIGATAGYTVQASGDNAGIAVIENLGWVIPKDSNKTLTVKGVLNSISAGADTGSSIYAVVHASNFEAQGATAKDTSITAAIGKQKVVYKTKPTFASPTNPGGKLIVGQIPVMRFKIKADGPETVAWKQIQFKVSMTGATMSAVNAVPGTTGNIALKDVSTGSNLDIASAFSSTSTTTGEQAAITGGNTGYVSILLNSAQEIATGAEKEYELQLTFADVSGTVGAASVIASIYRGESTLVSASTVANVRSSIGTATDAAPSFVWSDYSVTGHTESTADWANGVLVKILPSSSVTISN